MAISSTSSKPSSSESESASAVTMAQPKMAEISNLFHYWTFEFQSTVGGTDHALEREFRAFYADRHHQRHALLLGLVGAAYVVSALVTVPVLSQFADLSFALSALLMVAWAFMPLARSSHWLAEVGFAALPLASRLYLAATHPLQAGDVFSLSFGVAYVAIFVLALGRFRFIPFIRFATTATFLVLASQLGSTLHLSFTSSASLLSLWFSTAVSLAVMVLCYLIAMLVCYTWEANVRHFWVQHRAMAANPDLASRANLLPFFTENNSCPDGDQELLGALEDVKFTPVFISGYHRSGTTFLYEKLCRITGMAKLTPYYLFYFPRLLRSALVERTVEQEQAVLDDFLQTQGLSDRKFDAMPVNSSSPPEEYGFLLIRKHWAITVAPNNAHTVKQICQKLVLLQKPKDGMVLLKNPWDFGNEDVILKCFPAAKFIYITRKPIEILDSFLNVAALVVKRHDQYLWMVLGHWNKFVHCIHRLSWAILGEKRYLRNTVNEFTRFFIQRSLAARRCMETLPKDRVHIIKYNDLVKDTANVLTGISKFLNVEVSEDTMKAHSNSRKRNLKVKPELDVYRQEFLANITAVGLSLDG